MKHMGKEKEKEQSVEKAPVAVPVYTKASLLRSERFSRRQDALNVLLKDDESYTMEQVEKLLNDFMNERMK